MNRMLVIIVIVLAFVMSGCANESIVVDSPNDAVNKLIQGNLKYVNSKKNPSTISEALRKDTAQNGQEPYAVILTCSDSRVPPEHIFSAGLGELFVIRTAGNVVDDFELGSIEYGVEHLKAKVIVVMGHSHCGAIAASIEGNSEGHIANIVDEIKKGTTGSATANEAENDNIAYVANKTVNESAIIREMVDAGEVIVVQAKYDIETGNVEFFDNQ